MLESLAAKCPGANRFLRYQTLSAQLARVGLTAAGLDEDAHQTGETNRKTQNINKVAENIKKEQSRLKNTLTEVKNTLNRISRLADAWISDLEDRVMISTQASLQKEKKLIF